MGAREDEQRGFEQGARRLTRTLRKINNDAQSSRSPGLIVPIVDADLPATDPTNVWLFDDGRLRIRGSDGEIHTLWPGFSILHLDSNPAASTGIDVYHHNSSDELRVRRPDGTWARYASTAAASGGTSGDPGGSTTKPREQGSKKQTKTFTKTYSATWARTICPQHGVETGGTLYYGRWSATHGQRKVMIGFNDSAIASDLSGATIRKVWVSFRNAHAFYNGGVDVSIGAHDKTSPPGGYSSVRERVARHHWPKVGFGSTWRRVPDWFGTKFKSGSIAGLTINQRSDAVQFYGAIDWSTAKIRIKYTKEV